MQIPYLRMTCLAICCSLFNGCGTEPVEDKRSLGEENALVGEIAMNDAKVDPVAEVRYSREVQPNGNEVIVIEPESMPIDLAEWDEATRTDFLAQLETRIENETGFYAWYPGQGVLYAFQAVGYVAGAAIRGVGTVAYYGISAAFRGFSCGLGKCR